MSEPRLRHLLQDLIYAYEASLLGEDADLSLYEQGRQDQLAEVLDDLQALLLEEELLHAKPQTTPRVHQ